MSFVYVRWHQAEITAHLCVKLKRIQVELKVFCYFLFTFRQQCIFIYVSVCMCVRACVRLCKVTFLLGKSNNGHITGKRQFFTIFS